jgi:hypothetical protein
MSISLKSVRCNKQLGGFMGRRIIARRSSATAGVLLFLLSLTISGFTGVQASAFSGLGAGTEESPYLVTDCEQLQEINDERDAYYQLANSIDCSDTINWNGGEGFIPIGDTTTAFTGELDGQDFSITNLFIDRASTNRQGVFGMVGTWDNQVGLITNIHFGGLDITGDAFTGGIAGQLYGQLNRVHAEGQVTGSTEVGGLVGSHGGTFDTIINSRADVDVTGTSLGVGGLVGYNDSNSQIINSYATGSVTGEGSDARRIGGLVGHNLGDITSSHATGNVTGLGITDRVGGLVGRNGGTIEKSYATGTVVADVDEVGGLVGYNASGEIFESYSDNRPGGEYTVGVTGGCAVGGLVGSHTSGFIQNTYSRSSAYETGACSLGGLIGEVTNNSLVQNSYATGMLNGGLSNNIGGVIGTADVNFVFNFYDEEASGVPVACGTDSFSDCNAETSQKTTAEMQDINTFTTDLLEDSWNFETIWDVDTGINDNYPYFQIVGAEELNLAPEEQSSAGTLVLEPGGDASRAILVEQLEGTEICGAFDDDTFTRTESQLEVQDEAYDYTSHFVGFTLTGCDVGGTTTMRFIFTGSFDPASTIVRKYNSITHEFATVENAVVSATTLNDLPALDVRYEITDGGELDQDGEANGIIVDPVGLAGITAANGTTDDSLANSGTDNRAIMLLAFGIISTMPLILVTDRKTMSTQGGK